MKIPKSYFSKSNIKYVNEEDDLKKIVLELRLIISKLNNLIKIRESQ